MRWRAVVLSVLIFGASAHAEEVLREISWEKLKTEGKLKAGEVLGSGGPEGGECLKVVNENPQGKTVEVLVIEQPGITGASYSISGKVRYEGVESRGQGIQGKGYLEMWSYFPDGGFFFSRTLGETGPMQYLEGSSDWRAFVLPFFKGPVKGQPERLVMNVVLPGRGTVYVSGLRLVQYGEATRAPGAWWSERAGAIGLGIAGIGFAILGALVAALTRAGKGRRVVMGILAVMMTVGVASLVGGFAALACSQPYDVCYGLFLLGVVGTVVPLLTLTSIRRRYEAIELRRMSAEDAR